MITRADLYNDIKEITDLGQKINRFYVSFDQNDCISSNIKGHYYEFERLLNWIESNCVCNGKFLPITKLILYTETCVHTFVINPLADLVDGDSRDSYVYVNVPLIDKNLNFVDPKDL